MTESNVLQQVFALFYAIFWGVIANALPRWRAFAWPYVAVSRETWHRLFVSVIMLNVLPIIYFAIVFGGLGQIKLQPSVSWFHVLIGLIPAFAIFGLYRLWIAVILMSPRFFYGFDQENIRNDLYPGLTSNDLNTQWMRGNLSAGLLFIVVPLLPFLISRWCLN